MKIKRACLVPSNRISGAYNLYHMEDRSSEPSRKIDPKNYKYLGPCAVGELGPNFSVEHISDALERYGNRTVYAALDIIQKGKIHVFEELSGLDETQEHSNGSGLEKAAATMKV